jgi:hypothetical protein
MKDNRYTIMTIQCNLSAQALFDNVIIVDDYPAYFLMISSKVGCSFNNGLSTGAVFLILLMCFVAVYLLVGILWNRFKRHKRGVEVIPNFEFWRVTMGLFADGAKFLWRKVRCKKGNYETIT